jgi:cob(I)alamin adenosyltransferase
MFIAAHDYLIRWDDMFGVNIYHHHEKRLSMSRTIVRIDTITTRTGDGGQTSLGNGERISKADPYIEAIGLLDETGSVLGLLISHLPADDMRLKQKLHSIQSQLFNAGSDLCQPMDGSSVTRMQEDIILKLEKETETLRADLSPLRSFILPGGCQNAAWAHMVRATVRKAERGLVVLSETRDINPLLIMFMNRLSDYFFVLARHLNDLGKNDILWNPQEKFMETGQE